VICFYASACLASPSSILSSLQFSYLQHRHTNTGTKHRIMIFIDRDFAFS